jgi:hypothetical protein
MAASCKESESEVPALPTKERARIADRVFEKADPGGK